MYRYCMNKTETVRSYVLRNDSENKELENKITELVDNRFGTIRGISIMTAIVIVKIAKEYVSFTKAHIEEFEALGLEFSHVEMNGRTGQLDAVFGIKS